MNDIQLEEAVRERTDELRNTVKELRQDLADSEIEVDRLNAENMEIDRVASERLIKTFQLNSLIDDLVAKKKQLTAENKALREALEDHGVHDSDCVAGQWREGRPVHGGYETLYGYGKNEKWYHSDELPPCTCGLQDALSAIKGEPK